MYKIRTYTINKDTQTSMDNLKKNKEFSKVFPKLLCIYITSV